MVFQYFSHWGGHDDLHMRIHREINYDSTLATFWMMLWKAGKHWIFGHVPWLDSVSCIIFFSDRKMNSNTILSWQFFCDLFGMVSSRDPNSKVVFTWPTQRLGYQVGPRRLNHLMFHSWQPFTFDKSFSSLMIRAYETHWFPSIRPAIKALIISCGGYVVWGGGWLISHNFFTQDFLELFEQ